MSIAEEIDKVQSLAFKAIFSKPKKKKIVEDKPDNSVMSFFDEMLSTDKVVVESVLGKEGSKMQSFLSVADLEHPDLVQSIGADRIYLKCQQLLKIGQFIRENKFDECGFGGNSILEGIRIDDPTKTKRHVRFIKDSNLRKTVRKMKTVTAFNFLDKTGHIDNFEGFIRGSSFGKKEITKAKEKVRKFKRINCTFLAEEMKKSVDLCKNKFENKYYDFFSIDLLQIMSILALSHNFADKYSFVRLSKEKLYNFTSCDTALQYGIRIYPLDLAPTPPSEDMVKVISKLDEEANGKPIFDHFIIIVPVPIDSEISYYECYDRSGKSIHKEKETTIDKELIEGGYVHPILVGEKDGKCYFICYWK